MDNSFNITTEVVQRRVPVTIFRLNGRLDPASADILEAQARQAHGAGTRYILLDFGGVDFVTSAGLRAVLAIYKLLTPREDTAALMRPPADEPHKSPYLYLANLSPEIYYIFNISGFLHNIAIYNDLEGALQAFG
jgi:anti-anti-sigma factor